MASRSWHCAAHELPLPLHDLWVRTVIVEVEPARR